VFKNSYEDRGLIFATQKGTPVNPENLVKRSFKPLLERAASIFLPQRHYCSGTLTLDGLVCTLRDTELYTKG
jgi:hypothetical protein